ncbi:MAG: ABC transporter substrate-binding protein [Candidatus Lustribacter sp.]|jgi:NitT/TauT family transport system substrate-binding protein
MNRRTAIALGSAFLAAPVAAYGQAAPQWVLGGVPEESVTPALWAAQSGMFRKAGLDVSVQPASSGTAIAAGVAGGSYAVGKSSLAAIITAHTKGLPFVFVAGGSLYDTKFPYSVLTVKADSPLKTAKELNGQTLAVPALSDLTTVATKGWVDQHGGDSTTLKFLELPFAQIPDALDQGRVVAGFVADPILQQALDAKKVRIFAHAFDAIAPQFMVTGWFVTTDFATKNQADIKKFASVMRAADGQVVAHPADAVNMLAKFSNVDPAVIERTHRIGYAPLEPKYIQPVIDICAKYKLIDARFDAKELIAPGLT